jgi:hypothetical protein
LTSRPNASLLSTRGATGGHGSPSVHVAGSATTLGPMDRLDALARPDKWYLSAGEGVIWAPPFPDHLDRPGFWDEAHVFHFPVRPLFTVALVDTRGREIGLRAADRRWRPDRLILRWETDLGPGAGARPGGPTLVEERSVLSGARFGSIWHAGDDGWAHPSLAGAWLVAFSQIPADGLRGEIGRIGGAAGAGDLEGGLRWRRRITHREHLATELGFELMAAVGESGDAGTAGSAVRRRAVRSEGRETPRWALTPFPEIWRPGSRGDGGGLDDDMALRGGPGGWVHAAVAVPLGAVTPGAPISFTLAVGTPGYLAGEGQGRGGANTTSPRDAGSAASVGPAVPGLRPASPGEAESGWRAYFEDYPRFRCSDPFLERYWDYRIYGLRLNRVAPGTNGYPHPAIAEGIGYFHWPISYSAQCHMLEARWGDPAAARGSLLNFLAAQRDDGSLPGRLHLCPDAPSEPDFYHASWGDAALAVDAVVPDEGFRREAYTGLSRYARWLMTARDPEASGMVTITNHYETGQEYMSRYLAVDPSADTTEWEPRLALKGIDVTVYLHRLQRALAVLARRLGRGDEAAEWDEAAAASARAILDVMWDPRTGVFSDVDAATPGSMARTGIKAAVCFYPLLTDLLADEHVDRLLAHLTDPDEFWTEWPVPSSSVDDPFYDPDGLWKGKRHNCPWNGRVWPMTNSHVIDGLLRQWRAGRRQVGPVAAELLVKFVRMMFDDQDPDRPNCFEHYSPDTAHPSRFRGIDDYQHSWVLDLLARGAAGLDPDGWLGDGVGPGDDGAPAEAARPLLVVDPLPLGLESLDLEGALVRGHSVAVRIRGDELTVTVDGETHEGAVGEPLAVPAPGRAS